MDAELVLERDATDVVAAAERSVRLDQNFRHEKERDPAGALGRAGDPRQHEMDDVLGHVVLAIGDEDLGAEDLVGSVGLRLGPRAQASKDRSRPAAR